MTREIKFRIMYKKYNNTWLKDEYTLRSLIELDGTDFLGDDDIIEQYTGLKDKNGKKIYEGDIIEVVDVHDGDDECWEQPYGPAIPQEVKWDEERLRWSFGGCRRILYAPEDFEVIGNIHENPELLVVTGED